VADLRPPELEAGAVVKPDWATSRWDTALFLPERVVLILLIAYLVVNRLIADIYVLPIGISLTPSDVVLGLLLVAWMVWMVTAPHPMPPGTLGLFALALFSLLVLAPFIHALDVSKFQAGGAERGLFRLVIFTGLFLASFHLAFRWRSAMVVLGAVVTATSVQALLALWEFQTKAPVAFLQSLPANLGLEVDPRGLRGEVLEVRTRLFGGRELRAATTAPTPIVLSAVIAVSIGVCAVWLLNARTKRGRRFAALALAINVVGLPLANSRTGFVIVAALVIPLLLVLIPHIPRLIMLSLGLVLMLAMAFAVSPATPRLLLNSTTAPSDDPNTQIRLERFQRLPELMSERPVIGAGYLTHDPGIQIFDNAYNLGVIEFGIVGLGVFLSFFLVAINWCRRAVYRAKEPEALLPLAGFIAGLALLVAGATFDAWTFDQFFPMCLILLGVGTGRAAMILRRDHSRLSLAGSWE
jgi:hypothetical protein